MNLHEDEEAFQTIISATSEAFGILPEQVEKDYYVSYLLEHLVRVMPDLVFKGGTSLSKCYKIIRRFSEDIDINYAVNRRPTQGERKTFKDGIKQAISNAGLTLLNGDSILWKRDFNQYQVQFPKRTESLGSQKEDLLLETYFLIKSFPAENKPFTNYVFEFLESQSEIGLIKQFNLEPCNINAQRIDRTFIDKIFTVCDYYEQGKLERNSRHLYDLSKIFQNYTFERQDFHQLFKNVRIERQRKPDFNISSKDGYPILDTLQLILDQDLYREDYEAVTDLLLFEKVSYEEVKSALKDLIRTGLIPL